MSSRQQGHSVHKNGNNGGDVQPGKGKGEPRVARPIRTRFAERQTCRSSDHGRKHQTAQDCVTQTESKECEEHIGDQKQVKQDPKPRKR